MITFVLIPFMIKVTIYIIDVRQDHTIQKH